MSEANDKTGGENEWVWPKWMIGLLLVGHAVVACLFAPPAWLFDSHVYVGHDYPVHAHRVEVYRTALWSSGLPWGTDPKLCGGRFIHPSQDVGAKPHQAISVLLPFLSADKVVLLFSLAAVLACPVLFVLGGKMLGFRWNELSLGLITIIAIFWLTVPFRFMLLAGMTSFVLCTFFGLFTLGAYVRFFRGPTVGGYIGATAAGSALFLIHPLGPLAIMFSLALAAILAPKLTWKWRIATMLSPLIIAAVNSFWLVPLVLGLKTPAPPWSQAMVVDHPFWTWNETYRFADFIGPTLGIGLILMLLAVVVQLARLLPRRGVLAISGVLLVLAVSLFLFLFGSEFSITRKLQPVRYCITFLMAASLALGSLSADINRWLKIPRSWLTAIQAVCVVGVLAASAILGYRLERRGEYETLSTFIAERTETSHRLLVETEARDSSLATAIPQMTGRETISSAFPDFPDPVQFSPQRLFGMKFADVDLEDAQSGIENFGVRWVFVRSEHWRTFFQKLTRQQGEAVGAFTAFEFPGNNSRFIVGSGKAVANVNRIELSNVVAEENAVVIRYRYHPGWVCDLPASLSPFPIAEDPGGLIQINDPQPNMVLRFDPLRGLKEPWP